MGRMGQTGSPSWLRTLYSLFGSGQQGLIYDLSDISTLFQDAAGTTPVTAMEQPVGKMLDLSGNGNHASQATTTKRGVVSRRVNLLLGSTTLATQSITTRAAAYKLVFSGTGSVTLSGAATGVYGAGTNSITCTAGSLTLTVSGSVQDASFHLAIDAHLPYQSVNTDTDYDAAPNKFPTYIRFDGVDDAYQTNSIDFTGTDKMTVWAGVTKLSEAAFASIVDVGIFSVIPGFYLANIGPGSSYMVLARGSIVGSAVYSGTYTAPNSAYLSGSFDIAGSKSNLRVNGALTTNSGSLGTGNFSNTPLYIGASNGSANYFNGRLYGLIVRGAQSSQSQIEACELYVKRKMRLP